jgi:hypothetical protein
VNPENLEDRESNPLNDRRKTSVLYRVIYFFPFQLILVHIKHNALILLIWFSLFGFVLGWFGLKFGMNYLFLYPEYLGTVDFRSFSILGFALGGFISAFNVYSYIKNGPDFPFIATLLRPFHKYSINNFMIPAIFIFVLIVKSVQFQSVNELVPFWHIVLNIGGLIFGMLVFLGISIMYFFRVNKSVYKISGKNDAYFDSLLKERISPEPSPRAKKWYKRMRKKRINSSGWRVETYLTGKLRLKLARDSRHYDQDLLKRVFFQNHLNASIFEITIFVSFLMLGIFREVSYFIIPAGASVILFFTMFLMLLSAFRSWFRGWTIPILVVLFIVFNMVSGQFNVLSFRNYAYGLDYSKPPAEYSMLQLQMASANAAHIEADLRKGEITLENWKTSTGEEKPYLIVLNSSGGGLRSALWNYSMLCHLDSVTNGEFYDNVQFSTGASGGMIGSSYYRELYLRQLTEGPDSIPMNQKADNICKDLLNPVALSIATNDYFIRLKSCTDGKYTYKQDRGYTFENQLNINTDFVLDKRLSDYSIPEHTGQIPIMILSPTISNDSRRLLISSQPISYMCSPVTSSSYQGAIEDVEFSRLFRNHDANNLKFTSAIRMNATFPYILPSASLPTSPEITVMDAGIRDNIGTKSSLKYIDSFEQWIKENTKGVIIVQIRDSKKHFKLIGSANENVSERMTSPMKTFYGNFTKVHDYNNDQLLDKFITSSPYPIHVISFEMEQEGNAKASLSFHLTQLEKNQIYNELHTNANQHQLKILLKLLAN